MGCRFKILYMIFLIIFIFISFHYSHFLFPGATLSAPSYFNGQSLQEGGRGSYLPIRKVGEEIRSFNLGRFRALLGLSSFSIRKESYYKAKCPIESPAADPVLAPAPAPTLPHRVHSRHHHLSPRMQPLPRVTVPFRKIHKDNKGKGRGRRTLVAILVSTSATFVLCGIGLTWGCQKFRKRTRSRSTVSIVHSIEGGTRSKSKYVFTSQSSVKKVTSDPSPHLFYLDSIASALEPQPFTIKKSYENVNASTLHTTNCWNHPTVGKLEEPSDSVIDEGSAIGEIVSVNKTDESIKHEPVGSSSQYSVRDITDKAHTSDDESFHSLCNSRSSSGRLSNASAGSHSDTTEIVSSYVSKALTSPMNFQISSPSPLLKSVSCPPPPPPPPPLIRTHTSPFNSTSYSTKKNLSSVTMPSLSSPRNSHSSLGSNQTPRSDLPPSPCDHPKVSTGIPPPPIPPPQTKGNGNSLKGPPLPQQTPLSKDGVPLAKLKPLHWDKVRAASDHSMVWDKLRSNSFEFDEKMIESLFGYNLKNSIKNDDMKSKSPSPSKHVLEPKRLQNITILSKALNVTTEQVCNALMQGAGLSLQQLEALIKMEPTKEEEANLASYNGEINQLGSAEKFVKIMLNIPHAFMRIEAMLYKETFEDEVVHLRKSFSMLEDACKELRSSRLFLKLLEAVLKTGNRMNVGTIRGGARAFKLETLLKLADVKGTDGKTTLLHFVVQEIVRAEGIKISESIIGKINNQKNKSKNVEDREENYRKMGLDLISGLSSELINVKKTASVDLDVIASSVSNLSDGMTKLHHLVNKDLSKEEKSGKFVQVMRSFLSYAEKNLKELQVDESRVLLHVREITEYFHGNVSKDEANPLRIFVIVRDFLGMLDHVCKELRSSKVPTSPNPLAAFR
ncbi:FH2 domain-containing protein [Heracleum sosnowskyi]|uniref:Formin-like protein n=1 Tax=Heracleum sosnowskyi TaxID=360622 RepID=A0AAD8IPB5_9APIA|nr:FH2 domain-containing protein [Heracleum sosnowskyi]